MKRFVYGITAALAGAALAGCTMAQAPIAGTIFTDVRGGVGVTGNSGAKKVGTATCKGILGFAAGDCSIEAAMKNGNITKIHHVDSDTKNVLGIYAEYTVKVFGE